MPSPSSQEDRLVGVVLPLFETRDGRDRGAGTGCDYRAPEPENAVSHGHPVRAGEPGVAEKDIDTEPGKTLRAVHPAQIGSKPPHPLHRRAEVARAGRRRPPEPGGRGPRVMPGASGGDHPFRWHAADVEAVAAHEVPLDQRHPGAQSGGSGGGDQARGARTDDDQMVAGSRWRGVAPVGRVNVGDQAGVVLVHGGDEFRKLGHEVGSAVAAARARRANLVTTVVTATVAASPRPSTT